MRNLGLTCGFCTSAQAPAEVAILSPPKVQNPAILDMIIANSRLSHDFKPSLTASQRLSSRASAYDEPKSEDDTRQAVGRSFIIFSYGSGEIVVFGQQFFDFILSISVTTKQTRANNSVIETYHAHTRR
jgi:hypothetical protein